MSLLEIKDGQVIATPYGSELTANKNTASGYAGLSSDILLSLSQMPQRYNLSTFTEVDASSVITLTADRVLMSATSNEVAYAYSNIPAVSDFVMYFTFYGNSSANNTSAGFGILADSAAELHGATFNGIGCFYDYPTGTFRVSKWINGVRTSGTGIDMSFTTLYYFKLVRSSTTLTMYVYSDAARTTQVAGSPQSLTVVSTTYNYFHVMNNDTLSAAAHSIYTEKYIMAYS